MATEGRKRWKNYGRKLAASQIASSERKRERGRRREGKKKVRRRDASCGNGGSNVSGSSSRGC